ncbi:hypothetical protein B0H12DRAFT_1097422 [Mycena haematopus]|nr:hypothetical protein B0H12DRAFT_1097422 [Mycena haematopus]
MKKSSASTSLQGLGYEGLADGSRKEEPFLLTCPTSSIDPQFDADESFMSLMAYETLTARRVGGARD